MKKILTALIVSMCLNLFGQNLKELGINNEPKLTQAESEFLNEYMNKEQSKGFDFTNKKVLFITGPGASRIGTKKEYFDNIKEKNKNGDEIATWIVELNEKEQVESNYDVMVTYWVKVFTKRRKIKILKEIKASR